MAETTKPYQIVVGIDYSETGDYALEQALEMGTKHGNAEVHALSVVSLLVPPATPVMEYAPAQNIKGMSFDDAAKQLGSYLDRKVGEARDRLGKAADGRFPRIVPHLRVEVPAQEIAQLASDLEADLVVVGTHGRRGLSRVLLGSVAEAVVRLAPCPVLVVRKRQLVTVATIEPPCPECVKTRKATNGEKFWCAQHSERHGQRHTYHSNDRISRDGSMPLVYHGS
jgi:nucleotide-binding universal stress UspA family protein